MANFTFLEIHLDDASLSASNPLDSGSKEVGAGDSDPEEESSGKGSAVAAIVGLVFLVAVAYAARKKVKGGDDEGGLQIGEVEA